MEQIARTRKSARGDYEMAQDRIGNVYDALARELAPLQGAYDQQSQAIAAQLLASQQGLAPLLEMSPEFTGFYAGETGAAQNLLGTLASGGQTLMANDRMRNLAYNTSAKRQAGIDESNLQSRYLAEYKELLDDIRQQKIDTLQDVPTQILSRLDELRDRRRQNRLAEAELALREEIARKQESRADKEFRTGRNLARNQTEFARSEAERKRDRRLIRPIQQDIGDLKDRRKSLDRRIDELGSAGGPEATIAAQQAEKLRRRKRRTSKTIRKKRRRIDQIRSN